MKRIIVRITAFVITAFAAAPIVHAAEPAPQLAPTRTVAAFYSEHCVRCHKEGKAKGGFRMDELLGRPTVEGFDDPWKNVLEKLAGREMPPADEEKRPAHTDYEKQIAWLRGELEKSELLTAAARPRAQRRLNRAEYNRTVSDLFGHPLRHADAFPPDDTLHGFDTIAEGLNTSTVLLDQYLAAAQSIAMLVTQSFDEKAPEVRIFRQAISPQDGETGGGDFELYDGNSRFHWGGTPDPKDRYTITQWERREWIGHSWGAVLRPERSGRYTVTLRGRLKQFAPGERAILRLDFAGQTVGVFDSPAEPRADEQLFQTDIWVDKATAGHGVAQFTFVNGNPHGKGEGETDDYHPNSYERFRKLKEKHFPEHFGKSPDTWMPSEPPGLDVRALAGVRCEIAGPLHDIWPPVGFQREFAAELRAKNLRAVIAGVLPKAFRRPVSDAEVERIVSFAGASQPTNAVFTEKLQAALTRILVAPEFLFLVEAVPPGTRRGAYRLTDWELAARLSYFLTGTMPDAELRAAAARSELTDAKKLDAQVTRLLADPRTVTALTDGFLNSWLHLDRLAAVMPEPKLFPNFGDDLKRSMAEEPKAFFAALVRENGRVTDLLDARYAWVNERLAMHYGLDRASIRGSELCRVELPNRQRGGLTGMGALLTLTSENTRTSPVKRGIYVLEQIFNRPPPPPPPNVGDLIPNTASARSIREHLALHRENAACAGCHNRIDPWGLALENFDAVGAWRETELAWEDPSRPAKRKEGEKPPTFAINTSFELPILSDAAKRATGLDAVRAELLHRRDDFARGLTEKLMTYALGRGLVISDHRHIEAATIALKHGDYRLHAAEPRSAPTGLIDCQSHLFSPEMLALMENRTADPVVFTRDGTRYLRMGDWLRKVPPLYLDVDAKLAAMNAAGISMTALSINDPGPEWFGLDGPAVARMANDFVANVVKQHPTRFFGLCVLPLQDMKASLVELDRVHRLGMKGILLYTNLTGRFPDEPEFRPVLARAAELGLPVLLHPAKPLTTEFVKGYEMTSSLGNMFDTRIAITHCAMFPQPSPERPIFRW